MDVAALVVVGVQWQLLFIYLSILLDLNSNRI